MSILPLPSGTIVVPLTNRRCLYSPKPISPDFPTAFNDYKFPSTLSIPPKKLPQPGRRQPGSGRTDRIRAISPYSPHQSRPFVKQSRSPANGLGTIAPGLLFRRTHHKSTSLGTSAVSPSSSISSVNPQGQESNRKLILVGPAICRHLQNGGSVRVKDFSGAVVGWMH